LKAQELKDQGILDKLKPAYVILGCWSGLTDRSRSPFPPLASKSLSMPAAYITRDGNGVQIQYPPKTQSVFTLVELYRNEGTGMSFKRFVKIYISVPRYIYIFLKNKRLAQKLKNHSVQNDVSDFEVYDYYFSGIEDVFSGENTRIIVLFMPNAQNERPGDALIKAIANHPGIIFADGLEAIKKYQVPVRDYVGKHPQPFTHLAYAREILLSVRAR
jgi:hypothetical protein